MWSMCNKCSRITASLLLVAGVLFLLVDLGVWAFGGLTWWTVLFLVLGVTGLASSYCSDCAACCGMPMSSNTKKRR